MTDELIQFIRSYERANNSHVWTNAEPYIARGATYWFIDGTYTGNA